jgi:sugar phosphate isomerase/epimerase
MAAITPINTGVSLFSFTNEWRLGQYTLASLIEAVSKRSIGPGLEIVGFQSLRGYPHLGPDDVLAVRRLIDKYQRVPTSLATNTDTMRRRDRPLTEAEKIADLEVQMDLAVALGFPLVRIQMAGATREGLQAIAKSADPRARGRRDAAGAAAAGLLPRDRLRCAGLRGRLQLDDACVALGPAARLRQGGPARAVVHGAVRVLGAR